MVRISSLVAQEIAILIGLTVMSLLFVVLRLCARFKRKAPFGPDDYWILTCALLNFPYVAVNLWGYLRGLQDQPDLNLLPLPRVAIYLKAVYIAALFYSVIITFAKYSVLCFYRRVFGTSMRRSLMVVFLLQTIWMLVCCFESIFRCKPIAASWNVQLLPTAKCQNFTLIVIAAEPFNALLDFVMVALPLHVIRTLQLSTRRKVTISAIFLLGSFVGITCILRIVETARGNVDTSARWVYVQLNTGITCACLPTLRPLLPESATFASNVKGLIASLRTGFRSSHSDTRNESGDVIGDSTMNNKRKHYKNITDDPVDHAHLTKVLSTDEPLDPVRDFPVDRITVQHDIDVV